MWGLKNGCGVYRRVAPVRYNRGVNNRELSPVDRLLASANNALRTVATPAGRSTRGNPAEDVPDAALTERVKSHAAGLMRVNHAGEIAAQALYQGHAAVARDAGIEAQMQQAADEEFDHLAWCEQRLEELGHKPSLLAPVWYAGAFAIGAATVRSALLALARSRSSGVSCRVCM